MYSTNRPTLSADEIDDCLYLARVNEEAELNQILAELARKYQCQPREIMSAVQDPESGNTILHFAAANGFLNLLNGLLSNLSLQPAQNGTGSGITPSTSGVNITNKEGNTALHWASLNGHLDVVKVLVEAGADVTAKNSAGHSPAFEAERAGKGLVVEYLLEAGGVDMDPEDVAEVPNGHEMGDESTMEGADAHQADSSASSG